MQRILPPSLSKQDNSSRRKTAPTSMCQNQYSKENDKEFLNIPLNNRDVSYCIKGRENQSIYNIWNYLKYRF